MPNAESRRSALLSISDIPETPSILGMLGPSRSGFLFGKPADGRLKGAIEFIDADMKGSEPVSTESIVKK